MQKISEDAIERMTLDQLAALGYQYFYGPDIASGSLRRFDGVSVHIITNAGRPPVAPTQWQK